MENGPIASLELMNKTGRSISGHNNDLKRLIDIGALDLKILQNDKRKRIYDISDDIKTKIFT